MLTYFLYSRTDYPSCGRLPGASSDSCGVDFKEELNVDSGLLILIITVPCYAKYLFDKYIGER